MTLPERLLLELAATLVDWVLRLACRVTTSLDFDFDLLAVRVVLTARKGTCSSSFWPLASLSPRKSFQFLICAVVTL